MKKKPTKKMELALKVARAQHGLEPETYEDLTQGGDEAGHVPVSQEVMPAVELKWSRPVQDPKTGEVTWEVYELRPYVRSVEDLWHRLCAADVPLPMEPVGTNFDAYASPANKLLYLLSHEPWQYRDLRSDTARFLEAIDLWADRCVPRSRTIEAVTLALRIHNQAHRDAAASL